MPPTLPIEPPVKRRLLLGSYMSTRSRRDARFGMLLILPAVLLLVFVVFYPLVEAVLMSFRTVNLMNINMSTPAGLSNYHQLLTDPAFWQALKTTVIYVVCSVFVGMILGMAAALVLNEKLPFRSFFRGLALIPWVIPGVVVALLFLYMFNSQAGVIDYVLMKIGVTHHFIEWWGSTHNALSAEIIANVWNQMPFYMLMILAGLQTVPQEEYEAATIDGASAVKRFWYVTLPNIRGILVTVTSLMVIWNFNSFDTIWATTQGGPINATTTLSIFVYRTAFNALNVGYAAAIGVAWLIILLLFSTFYIWSVGGGEKQ